MKQKNWMYYLTAFVCGMTVMAVELTCSRLLAPYFSSSSIVWTVIIGLMMISLSLGNIIGGRSADKFHDLGRLYVMIWLASLWVAAIPFVGKYLIAGITALLMFTLPGSALVVTGSALSCLVIFSFPMVLMGMVSPYLVKLATTDMEKNGRITGQIYAMNTIGSIVGTFIPTFLTIPLLGTSRTFFLFALLLNILCLGYFFTRKGRRIKHAVTTVLLVVFLVMPFQNSFAFWKSDIVYEGDSLYNYLQVSENDTSVILSTNVAFGVQSIYRKDGALSGYYYEYALAAPLFRPQATMEDPLDVLVLGLGTGTFSKQLKKFYPNSSSDAVEIDAKIAELASTHFNLKPEEANVFINDGRMFLDSPDCGQYDVILADAYGDITVPFHMSTKEFFAKVKEHLKPNGVLVVNINMKSGDFTGVPEYLAQTVKTSFSTVYRTELDVVTNSLLFCSDNPDMLTQYRENMEREITAGHELFDISRYMGDRAETVSAGPFILTDDKAPVERLGLISLNRIVEQETGYIRRMLDSNTDGLQGILRMLQ